MGNWVAGIDGCKGGWVVALRFLSDPEKFKISVIQEISDILKVPERPEVVTIDMPIGLLVEGRPGGRICEIDARKILRKPRSNSVFSSPTRNALRASTYMWALEINRSSSRHRVGITRQCFGIFPKLREIDAFMSPGLQEKIKEVHPELCFWMMNNEKPMKHTKSKREGKSERLGLLAEKGFCEIEDQMSEVRAGLDDVIDACAACWTASRILGGKARRIPENVEKDDKGLSMEMWM